jgi:YD repeat-containing protein
MSNESDREKAGLRGTVKTCVEEINFPAVTLPDGTKIPERWDAHATDYDVDGRLLANRGPNSDGSEWITAQSYDADGRLTKMVSDGTPWPPTEVIHSYDGAGRLVSIVNSLQPGDRTELHYDAQGRKTAVQTFDTSGLYQLIVY